MAGHEYPAFSGAEMARRRGALTGVLGEREIDVVLVYGFDRSGSAVPWLTGWPVTREAVLLLRPGERDLLFVCYDNHVPNARRLAREADVRPGGRSALSTALEWLASELVRPKRLGLTSILGRRAWGPPLVLSAGERWYLPWSTRSRGPLGGTEFNFFC